MRLARVLSVTLVAGAVLALGTAGVTSAAHSTKAAGTPIVIGATIDLTKNMAPFDAPALDGGADRDQEDQRRRRRRRASARAQVHQRPARPAADQAGGDEADQPGSRTSAG